jgi:hypothetical protein
MGSRPVSAMTRGSAARGRLELLRETPAARFRLPTPRLVVSTGLAHTKDYKLSGTAPEALLSATSLQLHLSLRPLSLHRLEAPKLALLTEVCWPNKRG